MRETSKCQGFRQQRGDFDNHLKGKGIDIGAGPDPLVVPNGTVRGWDMPDGDAQLMPGVPDNEYDFVYSSHCLEHMRDVEESLRNWTRICKPGGCVYFVIPDYILYEKMTWPSRFNGDHKQSFSFMIKRQTVVRPNHYHVDEDLIPVINKVGLDVVRWYLEDYGFNYNAAIFDQTQGNALAQLCFICRKRGG